MSTIIQTCLFLQQVLTTTRYDYCSSHSKLITFDKTLQAYQDCHEQIEKPNLNQVNEHLEVESSCDITKDTDVVVNEEATNPIQDMKRLLSKETTVPKSVLPNAEKHSLEHANEYKNAEEELIKKRDSISIFDKHDKNTLALLFEAQKTIEEQENILKFFYAESLKLEYEMNNLYDEAIMNKTKKLISDLDLAEYNLEKLKEEKEIILLQLSALELDLINAKKRESTIGNEREGGHENVERHSVNQDTIKNVPVLDHVIETISPLKNNEEIDSTNMLMDIDAIQMDINKLINLLDINKLEIKNIKEEIRQIKAHIPPNKNEVSSEKLSYMLNEQLENEKIIRLANLSIKNTQIGILQMIPDLLNVIIDLKKAVDTQSNAEISNSTKELEKLEPEEEKTQIKELQISDCKVEIKQIETQKEHFLENFVTDRNEESIQQDNFYDKLNLATPDSDCTERSLKVINHTIYENDMKKEITTLFELLTAQNAVINIQADLNEVFVKGIPEGIKPAIKKNSDPTLNQLEADLMIAKQKVTHLHERLTKDLVSFTAEENEQDELINATGTKTLQLVADQPLASDGLDLKEEKLNEPQNYINPYLLTLFGSSERAKKNLEKWQEVIKLAKDHSETRRSNLRKLITIFKK
ncbi:hypothetical protein COBT_002368 [Conglomerata obtusa]